MAPVVLNRPTTPPRMTGGHVLTATFVRRLSGRDRVYVTRRDGTATGWDFPSYGEGLPHDLCHLVVEDELVISDGFWGLVDHGMDVGLVDDQATLMIQGRPLMQEPGADITGLLAAEEIVAALTGVGTAFGGEPEGQAGMARRLPSDCGKDSWVFRRNGPAWKLALP
jgi:hypothetical protein